MHRLRIVPALFAALAICTAAAGCAGAQAVNPAAREKAAPRTAAGTRPAPTRRDTAAAGESVSQRLFDAGWVVFPARLALVAVCLTIALLLLMCGLWSAVRVTHSLRHTRWSEPPRRLKRGEFGAAGTSVALEFEERLHANVAQDAERDQRIAELRETVEQISRGHDGLAAVVESLLLHHPELDINGPAGEM